MDQKGLVKMNMDQKRLGNSKLNMEYKSEHKYEAERFG